MSGGMPHRPFPEGLPLQAVRKLLKEAGAFLVSIGGSRYIHESISVSISHRSPAEACKGVEYPSGSQSRVKGIQLEAKGQSTRIKSRCFCDGTLSFGKRGIRKEIGNAEAKSARDFFECAACPALQQNA